MRIDSSRTSKSLISVWVLVALFIGLCVIFPLVCVFTCAGQEDFKYVMSQKVLHQVMKNTFLECICSTSLSVVTGYIFAYGIVKGGIPFKKFFSIVPLVHLITPPFVGGLAFILLFGRQGIITYKFLGLNVSLYGFWGLVIAQTLCFFPLSYLISCQVLRGINPDLERSARTMGASEAKIFFTITFPLSVPGIISSFLFIAVSVLSDFGNPLIVGGRFRVLAVEIYTQLTGWLNAGISSVLGIILVIPSIILFLFQNQISRKIDRKKVTIGDKGFETDKDSFCPEAVRIFLFIFICAVSFLILAQFIAIACGSFQKLWGVNTAFTFRHILSMKDYTKHILNSIFFAFEGALLSTIIAVFASFLVHRTDVPLRKAIDVLIQLPAALPGSLLGLAISIAAHRLHFKSAQVLIVIAMTVAFMPFAYRVISNTYSLINKSLDAGAQSLGAGSLTVLRTIVLPLSSGGVFSGFIYDFIRGTGTLSAVIFLVSFNTPLASVQPINLAEQGSWGKAASLALTLTLITFAILGLGILFMRIMNERKK